MVNQEVINQVEKLIDTLNNSSASELYSQEIIIQSEYYGVELNLIQIEKASFIVNDMILRLVLPNNRCMDLKLTDKFRIIKKNKIIKDYG